MTSQYLQIYILVTYMKFLIVNYRWVGLGAHLPVKVPRLTYHQVRNAQVVVTCD